MTRVSIIIATCGGAGHFPLASGTAGSVLALACYYLWISKLSWIPQLACLILLGLLSLWAIARVEAWTGIHDDGRIVIDEFVGMLIALLALPTHWAYLLLAFVLFRGLDIFKPFPANWIDQHWLSPRGVLMDDVISGIYAHVLVRGLVHVSALW